METTQEMLEKAVSCLQAGKVLLYPTEGVYGLGVDPENNDALHQLLQVKQRPAHMGLILLASDWAQLRPYILPLTQEQQCLRADYAGQVVTWVCPSQPNVSKLLTGKHATQAVRVSNHPVVRALCQKFNKPVVSTSANIHGQPYLEELEQIRVLFGDQIGYDLPGDLGNLAGPTPIIDMQTGERYR